MTIKEHNKNNEAVIKRVVLQKCWCDGKLDFYSRTPEEFFS